MIDKGDSMEIPEKSLQLVESLINKAINDDN